MLQLFVWMWLPAMAAAIALGCLLLGWMHWRAESSFLRMTWEECSKHQRLPPGDVSPWAIWGDTLELLFSWYPVGTPPPFLVKQVQRHGGTYKTRFLGLRTIVSVDPEVNRELLLGEGKLVKGNPFLSLRKIIGRYSLSSVHGASFKRLRSPVSLYLSNSSLHHNMHLLHRLQNFTLSFLSSWKSKGPTIYVQDEAYQFTFRMIAMTILGLEPEDKAIDTLFQCFQTFVPAFTSKFPFNVPGTTYAKALKGRQIAIDIIKKEAQKRQGKIASRLDGTKENKEDLFQTMINSMNNENTSSSCNEEELLDVIFGLLLAGRETVSIILFMTIKYLTHNQIALQQLKDEHERIRATLPTNCAHVGEISLLTIEDFSKMEFTQKVINETLRLANVAPFIFRKALQNIEIKGFTIPKGWNILLSPTIAHLDDKYYEDPLQFNPWRWKESTNLTKSFTPFGAGLRLCVGTQLARLEISMFLHYLVTLYRWEIIEKDDAFCTPATKMPKHFPIHIIPHP